MRHPLALWTGLLFLTLPAAASAAVFTIPLPEALGHHPCECSSIITFRLPGPPAIVRGISMHVVGTTEVGRIQCDDVPGEPPNLWTTRVEGVMTSGTYQYWDAFAPMPSVAGPFDWSATFRTTAIPPYPAADWDFLSDGAGEIEFLAGPEGMLLSCWSLTPPPTLEITGAWLIVDADIPVPVHTRSWGQLKAAYR